MKKNVVEIKHVWLKNPYKEDQYELISFLEYGLVRKASLSKNTNGDWHIYHGGSFATFRVECRDNIKSVKLLAQKITEY
jgi:hypothetical protein